MRERIIVGGALAQRLGHGGHAWALLQWVLGFQKLGWDVTFVDRLDIEMVRNLGGSGKPEDSRPARYLLETMRAFGLDESFALICDGEIFGMSKCQLAERVRTSAFVLNIMGYLRGDDLPWSTQARVFLDIDPGFPQMWYELDLADPFSGHDAFVTVALSMGKKSCTIPQCGVNWITTPPPVVLERWPLVEDQGVGFTTVASWRGPYAPVFFRGRRFGLRVHEFRRFLSLPVQAPSVYRLALDIHHEDANDIRLLRQNGWGLVDPRAVAGDPMSYQAFISSSAAEIMIAKNMYVATRSGWFSDRSVCYLASGRPVLAQDTGLRDVLPVDEGLIVFSELEEAAEGVRAIEGAYQKHARAARRLAEDFFSSDKVLTDLVDRLAAG